jgi:hypothetical protein
MKMYNEFRCWLICLFVARVLMFVSMLIDVDVVVGLLMYIGDVHVYVARLFVYCYVVCLLLIFGFVSLDIQ